MLAHKEERMTMVRTARSYDAAAIAALCVELGYAATRQQIIVRLAEIEARAAAVWVAEDDSGGVVGWLHVVCCAALTDEACAEIVGLVVGVDARGHGVGSALLEQAHAWARERGCSHLRVRSRIERERAHHFYQRHGYALLKTQQVLEHALPDPAR
ncbi:GNAT family N-acetyltransferase [Gammaproteobacteria bacterium PRO6]|nr:GNAT family N-acetyltransferase [Gammaproteobacteria bacterium PRO6]